MDVAEEIGVDLTESLAMNPAASVSGLYFAHPQSTYFAVGKINEDQVQSFILYDVKLFYCSVERYVFERFFCILRYAPPTV